MRPVDGYSGPEHTKSLASLRHSFGSPSMGAVQPCFVFKQIIGCISSFVENGNNRISTL